MPQPKAESLRARADWYVLKWRGRAHRQSQKCLLETQRLHRSFGPQLKRIAQARGTAVQKARAFVETGERFHDAFEDVLSKHVTENIEYSRREGYHIIDMMLPEGVKPKGLSKPIDYWDREVKGFTPRERLARARNKTRKRMNAVNSMALRGAKALSVTVAPEEELVEAALAAWRGDAATANLLASNEPWVAGFLSLVGQYEVDTDVLDGYEWLSTLDDRTCEECGALDGTRVTEEEALWYAEGLHPGCRCCLVPVSKTWEELGFDGVAEPPEGDRIARPGYPAIGPRGGEIWGPSSPTGFIDPATGNVVTEWKPGFTPTGGNQSYVPAATRYEEWRAK